jgi:hypothetical protein
MSIPNETVTRSLASFFRVLNSRTQIPISVPFLSTAAEMIEVASADEPAKGGSVLAASAGPASGAFFGVARAALLLFEASGFPPAHAPAESAQRTTATWQESCKMERTISTYLSKLARRLPRSQR